MVKPELPGAGGPSNFSSITFDGMETLISSMKSAGTDLVDKTTSFQSRASGLGVTSTGFARLLEIGHWSSDQVPGLQRRLGLARGAAADIGISADGWVIDEPVRLTTAQAEQKGRELAARFNENNGGDSEAGEEYHDIATDLAPYLDDPDVMSAFFAALGPQGVRSLPTRLSSTGSGTTQADLELFSKAFGRAFEDPDPPDGFQDIIDAFKHEGDVHGQDPTSWNRLAMLQYGDFPSDFVRDVVRANGFNAFADGGSDADFRFGIHPPDGINLSESTIALMFGALRNNPDAARMVLGGPGIDLDELTATVYGLDGTRGTGEVINDAFGKAVRAACGANEGDEYPGGHSPEAIDFAFRFIQASGAVEDVPRSLEDDLGEIAASYAPELLAGSNIKDAADRESSMTMPEGIDLPAGLDPAFLLSPQDTYRFIHGFAGSDEFSAPFDEEVEDLYDSILGQAATTKAKDPGSDDWQDALALFGNLAGFEYQAQKDVRGDMDAQDQRIREILAQVVTLGIGKVPTPEGMVAKYGWKAAKYLIGKGINKFKSGDPEQTRVAILNDATVRASFLQDYKLASILYDADYPGAADCPPELLDGSHLKSPAEIADDADLLEAYMDWTDSTDHGQDSDIDNLLDHGGEIFNGADTEAANTAATNNGDGYDW